MQRFVLVHPVIYKIEKLAEEKYLVYETLKFGFIPFSFTYPVTINQDIIKRTVTIDAVVFKLTKIKMIFALRSFENRTVIEEKIIFKSPLPIKSIMKKIFKEQHYQLFKNIEMA